MLSRSLAQLLALSVTLLPVPPAFARGVVTYGPHHVPMYRAWQPGWNANRFDRKHVILGIVAHFEPYRLQVARRSGVIAQIDLQNGTVILPRGATPTLMQRVAVVGYYLHGAFIANRVLLHN